MKTTESQFVRVARDVVGTATGCALAIVHAVEDTGRWVRFLTFFCRNAGDLRPGASCDMFDT